MRYYREFLLTCALIAAPLGANAQMVAPSPQFPSFSEVPVVRMPDPAPQLMVPPQFAAPQGSRDVNPLSTFAEQQVRDTIDFSAGEMLATQRYDILARVEKRYREAKLRAPSGVPLLALFHEGLKRDAPKGNQRSEESWDAWFKVLDARIAADPASPSALIAKAKSLQAKAWWYRGRGYSYTVTTDGWAKFADYSQQARRYLVEIKPRAAHDPEWYLTMILAIRDTGADPKALAAVLKETTSKFPYYYVNQVEAAVSMLPKWGGNWSLADKWARTATKQTEPTDGQSLYARIYLAAWQHEDLQLLQMFRDSPDRWQRMKVGMMDTVRRYPSHWTTEKFIKLSCEMEDEAASTELANELYFQMAGPSGFLAQVPTLNYEKRCRGHIAARDQRIKFLEDWTDKEINKLENKSREQVAENGGTSAPAGKAAHTAKRNDKSKVR
jgi:hypothetical protein